MCKTCHGDSNRKSNKKKRLKKSNEKCPENREKTKELPKCSSPKRSPAKAKKYLTRIEKIMLRIQPPIADRERYLHPEHVNCFLEESDRVYIKKPKCRPCPSEKPKVCVEDKKKKKKTKKTANENVEGEKDKEETTDNGKEKNDEISAANQEAKEDIKVEEEKENSKHKKASSHDKKNKKKNNKKKRKRKDDTENDSDSEMSICSNDSEVCLVGLGLTKEEKKTIEENRRKVHSPPDNEANSEKRSKDVQEVSEQEGEDKE